MKEAAADQAFQFLVIAIISGFGVIGFLAISGLLEKWHQRFNKNL